MCEITKDNFCENYLKIIDDLRSSSFISIDCEFSGIINEPQSLFDAPKERYKKLRNNLQHYSIIEIGLSTFHYDKNATQYLASSYSFYLSPSSYFQTPPSVTFEMNSVKFLCEFEFDFNKLFYKGLNYLNEKNEEKVARIIEKETILFERRVLQYIQSISVKVSDWRDKAEVGNVIELPIEECLDDFTIFYIHYKIRKNFQDIWTTYNKPKVITIKKITIHEKVELLEKNNEENLEKIMFDSLLGFTKVMKELRNLKKPIIGHNLLLDLMMIYKQFFESLPQSYEQFKKKITKIFPLIYDTKYLSYQLKNLLPKTKVWSSNSLSDLFMYFYEGKGTCVSLYMPIVIHKEQNFIAGKIFHEGGFDSFCTGFIFIKMAHLFLSLTMNEQLLTPTIMPMNEASLFKGVAPMKNRVNIARSTVKYINLDNSDPKSVPTIRLHIENIKGQPLQVTKILHELDEFAILNIEQLSSYCGIITVQNRKYVEKIIKQINRSNEFRISRYNFLRHRNWSRNLKTVSMIVPLTLMLICLSRNQFFFKTIKNTFRKLLEIKFR